jgi:hypothetical protein
VVLYDHVWSDGSNILNTFSWQDPSNWSNGSPDGDPDPDGAVVIFPEAAGSNWDANNEDILGEVPVKSLYYHRGGFETGGPHGNLLLSRDIFKDLGGKNVIVPDIRFTSDATNFEHHIQVNGGELFLDGDLTSGSPALLDKEGTGTLVVVPSFGNNQNFAGTIALHQGTLYLGNADALPSGTPISALEAGTILDLNNFDLTASVRTPVLGFIRLGSGTLSFSGGSTADLEGIVIGSGGLTVAGDGAEVTLGARGTFSYTGPTLVNAGTLWADGALGNHAVTVEVGGTLSGGGTVGAVTVLGRVHPGSGGPHGSGLTSQGNVLFEPGSSFQADIRGSGADQYDHLTATGTITLSDATTLVVTGGANSAEGDALTILHSSAGISGTFAGLTDGTTFLIDHKMFRINYTSTDVVLTHLPQFQLPPITSAAGGDPRAVVTGDFNGDGILDLAVADHTGHSLSVLLGKGDGTFQSPRFLDTDYRGYALAVGHFHNANILDLVVTESNRIDVFLGNGDGSFQAPVPYNVGMDPLSPVVGDVNGDGFDDIVVVNQTSHTLSILYGNGDGTFQDAVTPDFRIAGVPWSVALADLDNDGKLDLVTGNSDGTYGDASVVSVLLNQGNDDAGHAQFGPAVYYLTRMDIQSLAVSDLNGDGIPDVIFASESGKAVGVFLGKGDGTLEATPHLSPPTAFSGGGYSLLAIADFDGDGRLDVLVPARSGREAVLYGKGDGTFGPPSYYAMPSSTWAVAAGDFNGDNAPDLAVAVHDGTVGILLNAVARGAPAPPRAGQPPRRGPALTGFFGMNTFVPTGESFVVESTVQPPTSLNGTVFDPNQVPGPVAPENLHVDRFFALLDQGTHGRADFPRHSRPIDAAQRPLASVEVQELTVCDSEDK